MSMLTSDTVAENGDASMWLRGGGQIESCRLMAGVQSGGSHRMTAARAQNRVPATIFRPPLKNAAPQDLAPSTPLALRWVAPASKGLSLCRSRWIGTECAEPLRPCQSLYPETALTRHIGHLNSERAQPPTHPGSIN